MFQGILAKLQDPSKEFHEVIKNFRGHSASFRMLRRSYRWFFSKNSQGFQIFGGVHKCSASYREILGDLRWFHVLSEGFKTISVGSKGFREVPRSLREVTRVQEGFRGIQQEGALRWCIRGPESIPGGIALEIPL